MLNKNFETDVLYLTTQVLIGPPRSNPTHTGTGFFVKVEMPGTDSEELFIFLVSNTHVFEHDSALYLKLHELGGDTYEPILAQEMRVSFEGFSECYYKHANEDIDLSIINVSVPLQELNTFFKAYSLERLKNDLRYELKVGLDVIFVGYPGGNRDASGNYPLIRHGKIYSDPTSDDYDEHKYLIDGVVEGGSSGSPVFCRVNNGYVFAGVVVAVTDGGRLGVVIKPARLAQFIENCKFDVRNDVQEYRRLQN